MKAKKFELTFIKKEKISKDVYEFYFKRPAKLKFKSGQYLKIYLAHENPDDRGTSRHFTISSSPLALNYLTITTRVVKSSFKLNFNNLKEGETVNAFGPIGFFDFDITNKKSKLFIAGGIGVTPYHSILKTLEHKKIPFEIKLIASFSNKDSIIYFEKLKEVESNNRNIKIIYTLTDSLSDEAFESGRIDRDLIIKYCPEYKDYEIFITGSESFEESLIKIIKKMGVEEGSIFTENFPGY